MPGAAVCPREELERPSAGPARSHTRCPLGGGRALHCDVSAPFHGGSRMSQSLVVIFLSATQPAEVFETTQGGLIEQANEMAAHTRTIPGNVAIQDFDTAWTILTRDMKLAYHFTDVDAARRHVAGERGLTLHERTILLSALDRLEKHSRSP